MGSVMSDHPTWDDDGRAPRRIQANDPLANFDASSAKQLVQDYRREGDIHAQRMLKNALQSIKTEAGRGATATTFAYSLWGAQSAQVAKLLTDRGFKVEDMDDHRDGSFYRVSW